MARRGTGGQSNQNITSDRLLDFLHAYALNRGKAFTDEKDEVSVLCTLSDAEGGNPKDTIFDIKGVSLLNLIVIGKIFKDLFGRQNEWPKEVQQFYRNGSYQFNPVKPVKQVPAKAVTGETSAADGDDEADAQESSGTDEVDSAEAAAVVEGSDRTDVVSGAIVPAGEKDSVATAEVSTPAAQPQAKSTTFRPPTSTSMASLLGSSAIAPLAVSIPGLRDSVKPNLLGLLAKPAAPAPKAKPVNTRAKGQQGSVQQRPTEQPKEQPVILDASTQQARTEKADELPVNMAGVIEVASTVEPAPEVLQPVKTDEPVALQPAEVATVDTSQAQNSGVLLGDPKDDLEIFISPPTPPAVLDRGDLAVVSQFTSDIPRRSKHVMSHLLRLGIVSPDDDVQAAAEKMAALMNAHPAVKAKGGEVDITPRDAYIYLDRPQYAFSKTVWTVPLTVYRIWQAVEAYGKAKGIEAPTLNAFWSPNDNPQEAPTTTHAEIGRELYTTRILPLLDLDRNRHIQTFDQLNALAGFNDSGFRSFMSYPWLAYGGGEGGTLVGLSLDEIKARQDLVPRDFLSSFSSLMGCAPQDILPLDTWYRVLGDDPNVHLSKGIVPSGKLFDEGDLKPASLEVMQRIRDSGFKDIHEVADWLNRRLDAVSDLPTGFGITGETVGRAIARRSPFPKGFQDLVSIRITEAVNERRKAVEKEGVYTVEELFGAKRTKDLTPRHEAEDLLMSILQQAQNRHIHNWYRLAWLVDIKFQDLTDFYTKLETAYSHGSEGGEPVPSETLVKVASALKVSVTELLPHELWRKFTTTAEAVAVVALEQTEVAASAFQDRGTAPVEAVVGFPAIAGADGQRPNPLALFRARVDQSRAQPVVIAHGPAEDEVVFSTYIRVPDEAAAVAEVAADERADEAAAVAEVAADERADEAAAVVAGDERADEAAAVVAGDERADEAAAVVAADERALIGKDTEPQAASTVVNDFRAAAIEIVTAFLLLDSPDTHPEQILIERVAGVNRSNTVEAIAIVAKDIPLSVRDAKGALEDIKNEFVINVREKTGVTLSSEQVIAALRVYHHKNNTPKRAVLNRYIELGRDDSKDTVAGAYRVSDDQEIIKSFREGLLLDMVKAMQKPASANVG